jgi:2-dehydro-3-deoxyphosphogluconate aldolase/(4S)-4-hydroxy-2-oxoglutarate aldolase
MANFKRIEVYQQITQTGLVPVFYNENIEICKKVLSACYEGGVRVFEFTNRGDFAHEIFGELQKFCRAEMPELILGIGTIVDAPTASLYIQLGANFVVSPVFNAEIAKVCNRRKIAYVPGCATLTEISNAEEWGVEIVKVFPGDILKPAFVKGLKAPMPWTSVMVTGGVEPTQESIEAWFSAGVTAVGIGSQLFKELEISKIKEKVQNILAWIQKAKK